MPVRGEARRCRVRVKFPFMGITQGEWEQKEITMPTALPHIPDQRSLDQRPRPLPRVTLWPGPIEAALIVAVGLLYLWV